MDDDMVMVIEMFTYRTVCLISKSFNAHINKG